MARPLRIEFPGAHYHVTARGNERRPIFRDDEDRELLLSVLARTVDRYRLVIHAYCLMDNHYHVVVETLLGNLSAAMHLLNGVYAQRFNRRHDRVGHVFQGRYAAILIEREPYLLAVCDYVEANPVRAGLCPRPEDWPWSSYRVRAELGPPAPFLLTNSPVQFEPLPTGPTADRLPASPLASARDRSILGSPEFVRLHTEPPVAQREIPYEQRTPLRPTLDELFAAHGEAAMAVAYREHRYKLTELAAHLHCHYATVSRRLRLLETGMAPPRRRHRGP